MQQIGAVLSSCSLLLTVSVACRSCHRHAQHLPTAQQRTGYHGVLPLTLALGRDSSLADDPYPVCQALAGSVVEGRSYVTCDSFADLAALLDSPR